jgi:hypothetical protein
VPATAADVVLTGEADGDVFGTAVAAADTDADGVDDLLVGAPESSAGGVRAGRAYLFLGPPPASGSAAEADRFFTGVSGDRVGHALAPAGDLDNDGFEDLLIGAPQFFEADPGYVGVYLGQGGTVSTGPDQLGSLALAVAPNPVRSNARVRYTLATPASLRLVLYDVLGREVAVLAEAPRPAGTHDVVLEAGSLSPGVYVLRLQSEGETRTQTLVLTR